MGWSAFRAEGNTVAINVTTTATAGVQAPAFSGEPQATNYILSNATSQPVFVGVSPLAGALAVIPVPGTSQRGYYLGPNAAQSITEGTATYFSAIASTGTSVVYVTPGDGL